MKTTIEFLELNSREMKEIDGGGILSWLAGFNVGRNMDAGRFLESSGFNHAGANK